MKVLMITTELSPFVKVGGLADVAGALPKGLTDLGHEVRIVCPLYGCVERESSWIRYDMPLHVYLGPETIQAYVWETRLPGTVIDTYFIEYDAYYVDPDIYEGPAAERHGNDKRFTFLGRAALDLCYYMGWMPDVVHCHDWPAALVPLMLNTTDHGEPLGSAASVLTIHNLAYQGLCSSEIVEYANLPSDVYRPDCLEAMGSANLLKGGLYNATKITTVSPNYAVEIRSPEFGCGLDEVLEFRAADIIGIQNGIDTDEWDPSKDRLIPTRFSEESLEHKTDCKRSLQVAFGLKLRAECMLLGVVSRLYPQKGLELLAAIIPRIVTKFKIQVAVLGEGDRELQNTLKKLSHEYPGKFGFHLGFSNRLAHLIFAGSDSYVMPSRFEPCGLSQMYAMKYGAPPVVRATGGLVDTVEEFSENDSSGTGFLFDEADEQALFQAIRKAYMLFTEHPDDFRQLRLNGMRKDFSWKQSAALYSDVYNWAIEARS